MEIETFTNGTKSIETKCIRKAVAAIFYKGSVTSALAKELCGSILYTSINFIEITTEE